MKPYPKIKQFRDVIREVRLNHDYKGKDAAGDPIYGHESPYPTLPFTGRVKLHGTNAAVVRYADGSTKYQSREREIRVGDDNAGFALAMSGKNLDDLFYDIEFSDHIAIFGEWCGGNIQKGVAINQLPKMFVIFGYMVDGEFKRTIDVTDTLIYDDVRNIYHIDIFPEYHIDIDFNNPEASQNTLIDWTLEVEKQCPVGAYFGVEGIGEGLVLAM